MYGIYNQPDGRGFYIFQNYMTIDVIQAQATVPLTNGSTTSQSYDLGQQFLTFIKMVVYGLVLLKLFQLTFLRYRRKLALSDRIEKKYRYCHHELIDGYSEDENKLMHTTINNTIQNAQVKSASKQSKAKKIMKKVSFNTQKNSYHRLKVTFEREDEYEPKRIQKEVDIETDPRDRKQNVNGKGGQDMGSKQGQEKIIANDTNELGIDANGLEVQESKITQQTEASSLLEQTPKQELNEAQSQLQRLKNPSIL